MTTITVKNIPPDLYQKLKQIAESNHRSLNSEIIVSIERAVSSQAVNPEHFLVTARQLRERTASYSITEEEFSQAKNEGRP